MGSRSYSLPILISAFFTLQVGANCYCADQAALIIGNGAYKSARKLPNPTNDADGVAARLKAAGWEVQVVKDATGRDMRTALRTFCESHTGASGAMVFYAGHGVENPTTKKNYLLPVDAKLETQDDLAAEALCLDDVLDQLKQARIGLKIAVLDCCRDNPIPSRSWLKSRGGSGLAEVKTEALPEGSLLVFSTAPGKTAPDGSGKNSPFTTALLSALETGGSMVEIFSNVSEHVTASEPWIRFDNAGKSLAAFARFGLPRRKPDILPEKLTTVDKASKDNPFVNTLGMKFVPVPSTTVLFSVFETTVRDYNIFAQETQRKVLQPSFQLEPTYPVVELRSEDAVAFCAWLSRREGMEYRLPTDQEWSIAVGLEDEPGDTPAGKSGKTNGYPWGREWPPPKGAGNYADAAAKLKHSAGHDDGNYIQGYNDGYAWLAPVGSFKVNKLGIADLGGNASEWCEWQNRYLMRGASWDLDAQSYLKSSCRLYPPPEGHCDSSGFRCVLVLPSGVIPKVSR